MATENIPSVDLHQFLSEGQEAKYAFVEKLGKAYEDVGFVSVRNHGFGENLQEKLYSEVKQFFSLPEEVKRRYEIEGLAGQRGYTSFGKEHAKGRDVPDLKEFWQWGQPDPAPSALPEDYPDNVEVKEQPDFNKTGLAAYKQLELIGRNMLRAIALYLGLDEDYFDSRIEGGNSILRAIHYGPIHSEPKSAIRAAEHEDINLITLLMGASAEGLEILNKQGQWVPVTALPGQLVVNVGDMLQRLTNNRLRSTTHRVVNPPREQWHTSRYSIPFFLHPRSEVRLDCLDCCVTEDSPKQFEDISAGEYLDERLREIGLKK